MSISNTSTVISLAFYGMYNFEIYKGYLFLTESNVYSYMDAKGVVSSGEK